MPDKMIYRNCCENCGASIDGEDGLCNSCQEFFDKVCENEGFDCKTEEIS